MPVPDLVGLARSEQTPLNAAGSKNLGVGFQIPEMLRIARPENASRYFFGHTLPFRIHTRHGIPPSHNGFHRLSTVVKHKGFADG